VIKIVTSLGGAMNLSYISLLFGSLLGFMLVVMAFGLPKATMRRLRVPTLLIAAIAFISSTSVGLKLEQENHKKLSNSLGYISFYLTDFIGELDIVPTHYDALFKGVGEKEVRVLRPYELRSKFLAVSGYVNANNQLYSADLQTSLLAIVNELQEVSELKDETISPDQAQKIIVRLSMRIESLCGSFDMGSIGLDGLCFSARNYYSFGGYIAKKDNLKVSIL